MLECSNIGLDHLTGGPRQLLDVVEHRSPLFAQAGRPPVVFYGFEEVIVFEEKSQTATVVGQSVMAVVDTADYKGDQFTFDLAQRLRSCHSR